MGYPQPPTPIKTNKTPSLGVVTNTIKRKRTKDMDMRFPTHHKQTHYSQEHSAKVC